MRLLRRKYLTTLTTGVVASVASINPVSATSRGGDTSSEYGDSDNKDNSSEGVEILSVSNTDFSGKLKQGEIRIVENPWGDTLELQTRVQIDMCNSLNYSVTPTGGSTHGGPITVSFDTVESKDEFCVQRIGLKSIGLTITFDSISKGQDIIIESVGASYEVMYTLTGEYNTKRIQLKSNRKKERSEEDEEDEEEDSESDKDDRDRDSDVYSDEGRDWNLHREKDGKTRKTS